MLHGFMGSGSVFDHLLDDLYAFCNPITIDLAGHGQTQSPDDSKFYTAEKQVQQLDSIIRRLQFETLFLYGYSMGGRLAFQMITTHPELFSGVIIESSHCGIESRNERSVRKVVDETRAQQIENNFEDFIENWTQMPLFQHSPDQMKTVYMREMKKQEPKKLSASLRGFGAGVMPPVCGKLTSLDLPITLIAGELDKKYVGKMSEINEKTETTHFEIVKNAGHRVHADQPKKFIQILKKAIGR
jgi:2-succinyl-6-hydroxy-2,4-cyclohexadiene-1-carboxylate synthase